MPYDQSILQFHQNLRHGDHRHRPIKYRPRDAPKGGILLTAVGLILLVTDGSETMPLAAEAVFSRRTGAF
jgi:hypothetical protein